MDNAAPDEELMNRYRDGDAHAFEVLYTRHKGPLYRYLLRQCGAAALAEDVVQDADAADARPCSHKSLHADLPAAPPRP